MQDELTHRLLDGIDEIRKDIADIKAVQARHHTSLEMHMRRSDALERLVDHVQDRVRPLEAHLSMWAGAGKLLTFVVAVVGAVAAIWRFFA